MGVISLVATMKIAEGKGDAFETAFKDLQAQVRANEAGCLQYDLTRSKSDPLTYLIIEKYADSAALDAHGKTDYFKAAGAALGAALAGAPKLEILDFLN